MPTGHIERSMCICSSPVQYQALWLSGYSDRLEIYFLREQEFESLRRRSFARCAFSSPSLFAAECIRGLGAKLGSEGGWKVGTRQNFAFRSPVHQVFSWKTPDSVRRVHRRSS
jgi:hypothetical protein